MNKFKILLIGVLMALSLSLNAADKIFPYNYKTQTLENGLKVILVPMNSGGLSSYYTVVRTGSRDEFEAGKSGFAHFFEHMMFRGTKKYPAHVYDSIVISLGADANAYTTDDYTCYHLSIATEDLETVMDLESERFQNLDYKEQEFRTEAGAVYGEYRKNISNPFMVIWEKLKETAYDKHTYKHTTMGYVADIKNMPNLYEYSKDFYSRYYRPENCVIVVAGDFDEDKTMANIKKYYGNWKKGYQTPKIETEPAQTKEKISSCSYEGETNPILCVAFKGKPYNPSSKESIAAGLLAQLAFGSTSKIYKKLYLDEAKVVQLSPEFEMNRDPGLYQIWAMTKSEAEIAYVKEEILKTVEWFKNNLVDEKQLVNLKKKQKYSFLMSLDTPDNVAGGLARFIAITGGLDGIETEFQTLEKITPADIQNAAKMLTEQNRTIVTLKGAKS